jgi:[ribosomal protein S5]-alanine N-acetyltransferase
VSAIEEPAHAWERCDGGEHCGAGDGRPDPGVTRGEPPGRATDEHRNLDGESDRTWDRYGCAARSAWVTFDVEHRPRRCTREGEHDGEDGAECAAEAPPTCAEADQGNELDAEPQREVPTGNVGWLSDRMVGHERRRYRRSGERPCHHVAVTAPLEVGIRTTLHRLSVDDCDEVVVAVLSSRALHADWIDPPDTADRFDAQLRRAEGPEYHPFLIRCADDRILVGFVNVANVIRGGLQSAFCGYGAYASGAGRGLMTDGLGLVVRHAFGRMGLHRLEANIQPTNERSIALVLRCGFRLEGFSPRYLKVAGEWRDHNRYAVTVEDLQGRESRR